MKHPHQMQQASERARGFRPGRNDEHAMYLISNQTSFFYEARNMMRLLDEIISNRGSMVWNVSAVTRVYRAVSLCPKFTLSHVSVIHGNFR
jgi:hypothetical protein